VTIGTDVVVPFDQLAILFPFMVYQPTIRRNTARPSTLGRHIPRPPFVNQESTQQGKFDWARSPIGALLHLALHSTIRVGVDEVAETSHPEIHIADIRDKGSPITVYPHPSETDSICQREFSRFTPVRDSLTRRHFKWYRRHQSEKHL
jgi:hypothetical protein